MCFQKKALATDAALISVSSCVHTETHLLEKLITRALTRSLGPCECIREDEFSSNWPSIDRVETPRFLGVLNDDPRSFQKTWAVAPSELDHFWKLEKLIWPCAVQLALHLLPIHVILHSGATQLLYDSAETGFLAPYLSAFCHLFCGILHQLVLKSSHHVCLFTITFTSDFHSACNLRSLDTFGTHSWAEVISW